MSDQIKQIGHSLIQHGPNNSRVYLMKLDHRDRNHIITEIEKLAIQNNYTKIFCKVPAWARPLFERHAYELRAHVPGFYQGKQDVYFMTKFLSLERKYVTDDKEENMLCNIRLAKSKAGEADPLSLPEGYQIQELGESDVKTLSQLYATVYESYPFPITDAVYLKKTMQAHVDYFGVYYNNRLVAAASAEKNISAGAAEMTDFATLPDHRGNGLATMLLSEMEQAMRMRNMHTLFTIARAQSAGINITFARCGYRYSGTLINNTQIAGRIESMNVWYRRLDEEQK